MHAIAMEGALKLKEISYIHAESYPAGELKHGPIALIDNNMPVVFIVTERGYNKVVSNIQEVRARGGRIIIITTEMNDELKKLLSIIKVAAYAAITENNTSNKVATILCFVFEYTSLRVLPANLQPTDAPRINKPKSIL